MQLLEEAVQARIPQARLVPTRVGSVLLHLLQSDFPRAPLDPDVARAVWDSPPYWAFCWPGGGWLSQWLPQQPCPGTVVDLGCGSGILSIALRLAGWKVIGVDSDPEARLASAVNARANGVEFPVLASLEEIQESVGLLVLADFLYDPANLAGLEQLARFCPNLLLADCRLRHPPPGFTPLGQHHFRIVPDLDWGDEFTQIFLARRNA
ncbi:50S ribosomal protein L11 methyltransferase [bacterium]|nr:50S ribosomal protein L11 methyltransferase [bacterium]